MIRLKNIRFLLCGTVLLLCACDRQSVPAGADEVHFNVASVTRSNAIMNADDVLSLGVFGYSTGAVDFVNAVSPTPNLFHNRKATRPDTPAGGPWIYTPAVYWPVDLTVKNTFFAYSPHSSGFAPEASVIVSPATASGNPTLQYTIPEDITSQEDILYASPVMNQNRESNGGTVHYEMKHALCWLAFVVAPAVSNSVDELYTVNWLSFMATRLPTTATLNLGTGEWTPLTYEQVAYEFVLTSAAENISPNQPVRIIDPTSRLMLFPIQIDSELSGATIDLTFTYTPAGATEPDPIEYYYYMPFPTTPMVAGKVIVYLINISTHGISLEFMGTNQIEEWVESGESIPPLQMY